MKFYRCDRCDSEYTMNEYNVTTERVGLTQPEFASKVVDFPFDVCDKCRKEFEAWFRQPRVDKAFEAARKRYMTTSDKAEVTRLGLTDGTLFCPVCGNVVTLKQSRCPKCNTAFSAEEVNYVEKKAGDTK